MVSRRRFTVLEVNEGDRVEPLLFYFICFIYYIIFTLLYRVFKGNGFA